MSDVSLRATVWFMLLYALVSVAAATAVVAFVRPSVLSTLLHTQQPQAIATRRTERSNSRCLVLTPSVSRLVPSPPKVSIRTKKSTASQPKPRLLSKRQLSDPRAPTHGTRKKTDAGWVDTLTLPTSRQPVLAVAAPATLLVFC